MEEPIGNERRRDREMKPLANVGRRFQRPPMPEKVMWQCRVQHNQYRREVIREIIRLLLKENSNRKNTKVVDDFDFFQYLPRAAARLEAHLYRKSSSLATYKDVRTLRMRLRNLAVELGKETTETKAKNEILARLGNLNFGSG